MAVGTLSNPVHVFDTAFTIGMLAHEVHSRQIELPLAVVTSFLVVEINCSLFHLGDFLFTIANLGNFFVFASVVFVNALLLSLEVFEKERLNYAEG